MPGPAATIGSMHTCPMCSGTTPHVGGPVTGPGASSVIIGGKPAAVMGDKCTCAAGGPDTIVKGCNSVQIEGKPAVTVGDMTAHGGLITTGETTVLIGTGGSAPTAIMPIAEIPFPTISFTSRMLGNTTEAQANQQQLREEAKEHGFLANFDFSL